MASLGSLRSDLNYWNGQVNTLSGKVSKLKRRKRDVEDVKKSLNTTVNNNSHDANNVMRLAASQMCNAIYYSVGNSSLYDVLSGKDEKTLGSDNYLTHSDGELQRELNDICRQIAEAENALASARRKVSEIRAAIAAEERRQREAAARRAAEALARAMLK